MTLTIGSLFTGAGMLDRAAELLEHLGGIPPEVRRALLASPSTPPLDI